jgi:excisionase family DNA binding protein
MRKNAYPDSDLEHAQRDTPQSDTQVSVEVSPVQRGLPNRLMTAFEVARFVGCHDETIRRAYLRGLLTSQRFGVRGRRFHPTDVLDWIRRGAPTRTTYISLTK